MDAKEEPKLQHFSHQHPFTRSISPGNIVCNGCNLGIASGKDYYACRTCNSFSLHKVCFHLPRTTTHPAHPDSKLTLAVSPPESSAAAQVRCKACTKSISGFYYSCGGTFYHNLCLALPLSVMISGHPHPLKIHFCPPYDFSCDLCLKPSYKGWLYRCRFCEFDAHIACAISHKNSEPATLPDSLVRQISNCSQSGHEIMQLLPLRLGIRTAAAAAAGDEKSGEKNSPRRRTSADQEEKVSAQTEPLMNSTTQQQQGNPATPPGKSPVSGSRVSSVTEVPSYQFSDMCFSIDLHKSYSDGSHLGSNNGRERKVIPEATVAPAPPAFAGGGRGEAGSKNWGDSHKLLHNNANGKPARKDEKKIANAYGIHGSGKKPSCISESDEDTGCSCWRRLIMFCCS
ncbi:unnamed protein product [Linum trigynum]|uniref:DC1 domain-containing protein n=1 Tax=Linum trigynum TaxID=586398 RepID=A0AAV2DEQ0_9ROSI